jgi:hypothetical protein
MSSTGCTGCTGCTGWAHAAADREWLTARRKPLANRECGSDS